MHNSNQTKTDRQSVNQSWTRILFFFVRTPRILCWEVTGRSKAPLNSFDYLVATSKRLENPLSCSKPLNVYIPHKTVLAT